MLNDRQGYSNYSRTTTFGARTLTSASLGPDPEMELTAASASSLFSRTPVIIMTGNYSNDISLHKYAENIKHSEN